MWINEFSAIFYSITSLACKQQTILVKTKDIHIHQAIKYAFLCSIPKIKSYAKDIFNVRRHSKFPTVFPNSGYKSWHIHITSLRHGFVINI